MPEIKRHALLSRFFWIGCAIETALLAMASALALLFGQPVFSDLHWRLTDFLLGVIAAIPICVLFWWMLQSSLAPLARIRRLLVAGLRPLFACWSIVQLGFISILAGICEEVLFRSVIQGTLSAHTGPLPALIIASAIFGVAHFVTLAYAVIAAVIGAYLGVLWLSGGNLLIPITTHAAYDFVALVYFLRFWEPESPVDK